jgi:hypothetical protein
MPRSLNINPIQLEYSEKMFPSYTETNGQLVSSTTVHFHVLGSTIFFYKTLRKFTSISQHKQIMNFFGSSIRLLSSFVRPRVCSLSELDGPNLMPTAVVGRSLN